MQIQIQPDDASCMATAVAMVVDRPVEEVIQAVGVPYKDIIHFGAPGSMKYRGFHAQDFTEYLDSIGWILSLQYARVPLQHLHLGKKCILCGGTGKFKGRWEEFNLTIENKVGILQYANHFCAWDGNKVYNPNGEITDFYTTRLIGFHRMARIWNT